MKLMPPSDLEQIAGGGAYQDGVGFAIGIDRVLLALEMKV